jgi:uncharacterized protein YsxB (DUF464 family)
MIQLEATLDDDDILTGYRANGHAGAGASGTDIVCAAISVLSRSLARALRGKEGINIRMDAPDRGAFSAAISYSDNAKQFLRGAGSFLLEGLMSVAEEYPSYCSLTIVKRTQPKT